MGEQIVTICSSLYLLYTLYRRDRVASAKGGLQKTSEREQSKGLHFVNNNCAGGIIDNVAFAVFVVKNNAAAVIINIKAPLVAGN